MYIYGHRGWGPPPPHRGGCGCGCGSMLLVLFGLLFLAALRYVFWY